MGPASGGAQIIRRRVVPGRSVGGPLGRRGPRGQRREVGPILRLRLRWQWLCCRRRRFGIQGPELGGIGTGTGIAIGIAIPIAPHPCRAGPVERRACTQCRPGGAFIIVARRTQSAARARATSVSLRLEVAAGPAVQSLRGHLARHDKWAPCSPEWRRGPAGDLVHRAAHRQPQTQAAPDAQMGPLTGAGAPQRRSQCLGQLPAAQLMDYGRRGGAPAELAGHCTRLAVTRAPSQGEGRATRAAGEQPAPAGHRSSTFGSAAQLPQSTSAPTQCTIGAPFVSDLDPPDPQSGPKQHSSSRPEVGPRLDWPSGEWLASCWPVAAGERRGWPREWPRWRLAAQLAGTKVARSQLDTLARPWGALLPVGERGRRPSLCPPAPQAQPFGASSARPCAPPPPSRLASSQLARFRRQTCPLGGGLLLAPPPSLHRASV